MRGLDIPHGLKGGDLMRHLKANKDLYISKKKSIMKEADGVGYVPTGNGGGNVVKSLSMAEDMAVKNSTIINTCYWYDSHGDVHIPKIWNKSLADNSRRAVNGIPLIQEHQLRFDKVIADKDNVKPYVKEFTWRELGVDVNGVTECLVFDNVITPKRNPFMYNQYKDGNVGNHSVGMYYVDIAMAIGIKDKEFKEENDNWDAYYDKIANKEDIDDFFWAVRQAKVIEGSAVVKGSNIITPVIDTGMKSVDTTSKQPFWVMDVNKIYK